MPVIQAEILAVQALREYLLRTLPAKVASLNAERIAVLRAAYAGPYTVGGGAILRVGSEIGSEVPVLLSQLGGLFTAAELVDVISAQTQAVFPSVDAQGRLVLEAEQGPGLGSPSIVSLASDAATPNTNVVFGWDAGGERCVRSALIAPASKGICDGWPVLGADFGPGFAIVIGDRETVPLQNIREDQHLIAMPLTILQPNTVVNRNREGISQCVRAVREVLLADRTLDNRAQLVEETGATIGSRPFQWESVGGVSPLYDAAELKLRIRIHERPT